MPTHYHDDEYTGSEHATDVFKAPTPELTEEEKKQKRDMEKGQYIDTGELDQQGEPLKVSNSDIWSDITRQQQLRDAEENREFDEAVANPTLENLKKGVEIKKAQERAKKIRAAEDEIDPQTGWPMYLLKGPLWLLNKIGEGFDWVDKQAGIPGTDIDVYHARRKILDPLSETHLALGILGEIFLPDSIDIATAGFSYIPNRFRKAGKAGIKLWANLTKARKGAEFKAAKIEWDKGLEFAAKAQGRPYDMKYLNEEGIIMSLSADDLPLDAGPGFGGHRPLPGKQHVSGLVPTGKFNGKIIRESTVSTDPADLINPRIKSRPEVAKFTTGLDEAESAFNDIGMEMIGDDKSGLAKIFSRWVPKVNADGIKLDWRNHHIAPVKQLGYAVNGLKGKYRQWASEYIAKRIGNKIGMSPEQANILPHDFHILTHRLLNDSMGRGFTIKNIEKKLGLKPGEWEGLELWKRKEGLDLIADSILESKQAINKFYQYATSQLQGSKTLDPDVFVNVMEEVLDLNTQLYMIRPDDYRSLTDLVDQMVGRKGIINNIIGAPAGKTVRPRSIAEQVKLIQSRLGKYKTDMEMKIMKARRGKSEVKVINPSESGQDHL